MIGPLGAHPNPTPGMIGAAPITRPDPSHWFEHESGRTSILGAVVRVMITI